MGLDFVGNPNKIVYEDIDDIGIDDYSDDENFEAFGNWIEVYESSEYDDADDFDYDPYEDFLSESNSSNASELPGPPFEENSLDVEMSDEEVAVVQQKCNSTVTDSSSTNNKTSEESADLDINEADCNV